MKTDEDLVTLNLREFKSTNILSPLPKDASPSRNSVETNGNEEPLRVDMDNKVASETNKILNSKRVRM